MWGGCREVWNIKYKSIEYDERGGEKNGVYTNTAIHQHGDGPCPNEFETSYAPERKEIVFCERCYNAEMA
ncbi:MAG: hypothetical protein V1696_02855 [Candidatus Jorgensenbacteria bacterium]